MPFVETLESYSRALYLPLRGYVRRPFQFATQSIRDHVPHGLFNFRKAMEHTFDGLAAIDTFHHSSGLLAGTGAASGVQGEGSQAAAAADFAASAASGTGAGAFAAGSKTLQTPPSILHFFTSPYFLVLCFMSIVMNRINAIVAPRNPHPLKLSVRFALKIPAFYLLMKSAVITLALLTQDRPALPLSWMLAGVRASYTESSALWLSFIAMGVSCTVDSFIANLHAMGTSEQTINMLEWAVLLHFTPSGTDILIISVIQVCQQLALQILSLSSRGKNYRLFVTTFWGVLDLTHFTHAVYYRSSTYPSLQLLARLPEVVVILMVCISMTIHALTYIVTGGNVRRQMFEPRAMPTLDEEYGLAVFKLGRACMEATRGVGFRNEVDAVVVPIGTILDRKQTNKSRSSSRLSSGDSQDQHNTQHHGSANSFFNRSRRPNSAPVSGFSNEMEDAVETPNGRQQISRRRSRMNVMKEFCQSSASLIAEMTYGAYNRIVPTRFRRAPQGSRASELGTQMSIQEYIQLRTTIENALERARHSREMRRQMFEAERYRLAAALEEEEEEELYNEFLSRDLTASDDEDEDLDVDYMIQDESAEDEDDDLESEGEDHSSTPLAWADRDHESGLDEGESYGIRRRVDSDDEMATNADDEPVGQVSAWRALGSLQDFLLDTSFMSIFLSGRLQETPLTRSQYRLALNSTRDFQGSFSVEYGAGRNSNSASSSSTGGFNATGSDSGAPTRRKKDLLESAENRTLLEVLNRYRRSVGDNSTSGAGSAKLSETTAPPPPLAKNSEQDDGSIYSRLLCVRFKQCPCCRSDVQGFSKVYLP
ncbi:hypothetical protein BGZ99_000512 [Dissophora globulifera]|uniref:Uncharacterized protein n=1 Tax=Dissophora globulifera TaxID=979702 RepID=A0A9P6V0Q3_9FUNG|nr:hypothetical protein BGZ99_000512 [Dissophora globulifera]